MFQLPQINFIAIRPFSLEDCWTSSIKPYSREVFLIVSNFDLEQPSSAMSLELE